MSFSARKWASVVFVAAVLLAVALPCPGATKTKLRVDDYQIDVELNPHAHKIAARARVKFTASEEISFADFELHNALRVTKVTDESGKTIPAERITQDSAVRVQLSKNLCQRSVHDFDFRL